MANASLPSPSYRAQRHARHGVPWLTRGREASRAVALLGRICLSAIFITAGPAHFLPGTIAYAASQGVPMANMLVPLSGALSLVGGFSVLLGYHTKVGAWLLVAFLVPVTLMMHRYWAAGDAQAMQLQQAMFMKNVAIMGGALLLAFFGGGPYSLDARVRPPRSPDPAPDGGEHPAS
jgi:putative oxidoreductase